MKHIKAFFLILISLQLFLSACGPVMPVATPTATAQPTHTMEPSLTPSPTATSTPLPTATQARSCPTTDSKVEFNFSEEFAPFEASILEYLNAGGDWKSLKTFLDENEQSQFDLGAGDITGDNLPEIFVITSDFFENNHSRIRIYQCELNRYALVKTLDLTDQSGGAIETTDRIFAGQNPFIVLQLFSISGWSSQYAALNWHDGNWQMIKIGEGFFPEIAFMDQDNDGNKEAFIRSDTSTPPGGGVGRYMIETYQWDGKKFKHTNDELPPATERIHYIEDAQKAWIKDNPFLAISYYEIAASDIGLSSYPTTFEIVNKQVELADAYQRAFSYFRIVAIWLSLGRPDNALRYRERMADTFPAKKPGYEFVLAADEMIKAYPELQYPQACHKAAQFLDENYPDLFINHLGEWGAMNIDYSKTSDMCTFGP